MYKKAFSKVEGVGFPKALPNSKSARHLFTIWVDPKKREQIMWKLQDRGIGVAVNFRSIHLMKYYRKNFGYQKGMFPVSEKIGESTITLPLYPKLTDEEVEYVIEEVKRAIL